jgi:hypothetical protein
MKAHRHRLRCGQTLQFGRRRALPIHHHSVLLPQKLNTAGVTFALFSIQPPKVSAAIDSGVGISSTGTEPEIAFDGRCPPQSVPSRAINCSPPAPLRRSRTFSLARAGSGVEGGVVGEFLGAAVEGVDF